ncbi:MAG: lipopolysaccharide biosynthesis protein RfbH [Nitrospirae bacterium]|nr:lipopolysaccharide biosynthesis protein RfbH [Nitrospirota bacterium]
MRTKEEIKKEIYSRVKEYYDSYLSTRSDAIPVSGKKYDEKELISIVDAALEGWWTEGKVTLEFEEKFKKFLGVNNAIVVNSGSSANLLALKALMSQKLKERRIKPGDEIITVAASFPTTVNPIIQSGCVPVFCDVDIGTYNINVSEMKKALSSKTKAVSLAHTLGNPFNLKEVSEFCRKNKLWLIEDSCDALGAKYDGKMVGTFGDIATFSFYPAHHITMGEGGAVVTNNNALAKIIRSIRDWGRDCWCMTGHDNTCGTRYSWKLGDLPYGYDHKYIYSEIGYNLKNTDLNAAIGVAQMDKLPAFISDRRKNFEELLRRMKKFEKYFYLPAAEPNSEPSWFGFLLTVKENAGFTREDLLKFLEKEKIGTRLLFGGNLIKQPYFINNKINYRVIGDLKNTDFIMKNTFWIGVCPLIEKKDIEKINSAFERFLKK